MLANLRSSDASSGLRSAMRAYVRQATFSPNTASPINRSIDSCSSTCRVPTRSRFGTGCTIASKERPAPTLPAVVCALLSLLDMEDPPQHDSCEPPDSRTTSDHPREDATIAPRPTSNDMSNRLLEFD